MRAPSGSPAQASATLHTEHVPLLRARTRWVTCSFRSSSLCGGGPGCPRWPGWPGWPGTAHQSRPPGLARHLQVSGATRWTSPVKGPTSGPPAGTPGLTWVCSAGLLQPGGPGCSPTGHEGAGDSGDLSLARRMPLAEVPRAGRTGSVGLRGSRGRACGQGRRGRGGHSRISPHGALLGAEHGPEGQSSPWTRGLPFEASSVRPSVHDAGACRHAEPGSPRAYPEPESPEGGAGRSSVHPLPVPTWPRGRPCRPPRPPGATWREGLAHLPQQGCVWRPFPVSVLRATWGAPLLSPLLQEEPP